jgi:hypothetical protein
MFKLLFMLFASRSRPAWTEARRLVARNRQESGRFSHGITRPFKGLTRDLRIRLLPIIL